MIDNLTEAIRYFRQKARNIFSGETFDNYGKLAEWLTELQERREVDRWIPVSERLPEEGNKAYLVTVDYGNGVIASCQRFFYNGGIGWNDDCVTAWKEMPEPYKESEDK